MADAPIEIPQDPAPQDPAPQDPAPQDPAPKRVSTGDAMAELKDALSNTLSTLGGNAQAAATQMEKFLQSIEPDVDAALQAGDLMSLGFLRDRVMAQTGRVSLGLIYQERQVVIATVTSVLRILIKIGIGSIAVG